MTFDLVLDNDNDYDGLMDVPIVVATQNKGLTSKTSQFSQAKLKISVEWKYWSAAEWKQLDTMRLDKMFGKPALKNTFGT